MNKPMPWFRMYTDFLNDPKMIALAFEDQRHFIAILALKSEGVTDQVCESHILDRIVAQKLWVDYAIILDVKKRLIASDLIDDNWQPISWNKRQMRSDADSSNADRQRRYRENNKRNALRNGEVTATEEIRGEEKREDKIKPVTASKPKLPADIDPEKWAEWMQVRKTKKAVNSPTALKALHNQLDKCVLAGIPKNVAITRAIEKSWLSINHEWIISPNSGGNSFSQPQEAKRRQI
jgi:hypothetical protein